MCFCCCWRCWQELLSYPLSCCWRCDWGLLAPWASSYHCPSPGALCWEPPPPRWPAGSPCCWAPEWGWEVSLLEPGRGGSDCCCCRHHHCSWMTLAWAWTLHRCRSQRGPPSCHHQPGVSAWTARSGQPRDPDAWRWALPGRSSLPILCSWSSCWRRPHQTWRCHRLPSDCTFCRILRSLWCMFHILCKMRNTHFLPIRSQWYQRILNNLIRFPGPMSSYIKDFSNQNSLCQEHQCLREQHWVSLTAET